MLRTDPQGPSRTTLAYAHSYLGSAYWARPTSLCHTRDPNDPRFEVPHIGLRNQEQIGRWKNGSACIKGWTGEPEPGAVPQTECL